MVEDVPPPTSDDLDESYWRANRYRTEFVGLTVEQAEALATQHDLSLQFVLADG